ncbi:hypothetical protein ACHAXR_009960 [Thalassiosira sp. AJA248-18]
METDEPIKEMEVSAPTLADPIVAPEIEHGVNAEEGGAVQELAKAEEEQPPIPMPPPLLVAPEEAPMPGPSDQPTSEEGKAMSTESEEITITDQDVLFGRGGLTNRHIGNLRYRDIISIHRQDYVNAQKTEKPNVARRIVKAIRTGKNPGRFLKKGEHGKWVAVSDKEAAWKASQALREKSRWSSMKQDTAPPADATVDSTVQKVVETANNKTVEKAKKRKAEEPHERHQGAVMGSEMKKVKSKSPVELSSQPQNYLPVDTVPTEISVPPVEMLGNRKVGANSLLFPKAMNTNASDIFPKDEDVIFGRGGRTNHHPGNKRLREIVNKYRDTYHNAKKVDKPKVSKLIVSALRDATPPSRFLRMNEETTQWEDVGDKRAAEKVSQTLREKDKAAKQEYLSKRNAAQAQDDARESLLVQVAAEAVQDEPKMEMAQAHEIRMAQAHEVPHPSPLKGTTVEI